MSDLYLASRSPRRRALLDQIRLSYEPLDVEVDEARLPGEAPESLVQRLASAKATAGARALQGRVGALVLGADTEVVLGERVLGKPECAAAAVEMLGQLAGRTHQVMTAAALSFDGKMALRLSVSAVRFREISRRECEAYVATGEPMDKAGGYAIQGLGGLFVTELRGSYSGVVGLALHHVEELLAEAGVAVIAPQSRSRSA